MEKQIVPGLRTTFLVHSIVGLIFGLVYLLIPDMLAGWFGVSLPEAMQPMLFRMLGAAILAFTASSWWAYHETAWERVKIIVEMELVWTILGTLVLLWGLLLGAFPAAFWISALILAAFAAAFGYFLFAEGRLPISQARGRA